MNPAAWLLPLLLSACVSESTSSQSTDGGSCPARPDMATPAPKCAAAKGLAGDNLLCVDFKDGQKLSDMTGWDFSLCTAGWTVSSNRLQVNGFSTFMDTCTAKLPAVSAADYPKYSSFTLSIVQRADLNEVEQKAQIMLGADDASKRLLAQMTGKQPRQRNLYEILKTDLPMAAMGSFQPLLKISSNVQVGTANAGWQIESIAIQGVP